jgi:hypothetical protein
MVAVLGCGAVAARADVVSDWNAIMLTAIAGQNPVAQTRYAAITQLAVFGAVDGVERVATHLLAAENASLSEKARALALVNMAIADAAIAVFDTKYHYVCWRPETAVHFADFDDKPRTDPDVSFAPFVTTPCFPSYPSARVYGGIHFRFNQIEGAQQGRRVGEYIDRHFLGMEQRAGFGAPLQVNENSRPLWASAGGIRRHKETDKRGRASDGYRFEP